MSDDTTKNLQDRLEGKSSLGGMNITKVATIQVTVAELKDVIEKSVSKSCPITKSFDKGIQNLPDNFIMAVEKPDLEAVMSGSAVTVHQGVDELGALVLTKTVTKTASPKKKKKEEK